VTPTEWSRAGAQLDDAETVIRIRIPDLDDRVTSDRLAADVVRLVVVAVVVRMLRNPGGYRSETAGTMRTRWTPAPRPGRSTCSRPNGGGWAGRGRVAITPDARPTRWPWWARHRDHLAGLLDLPASPSAGSRDTVTCRRCR
jgi:hypothetical protein